ncbi:macrolide family glycosyltransferase [Kutzneria sp. CA-103260]|uniref:macrolide family glycosyltransferase n=1 Tax=Kutzneria sp. CA-103260 TaxID=2802641 RepID=UPI001BA81296|nr:macrolide family glycosyltransferase [Kutzneria sp. CA-103260]QUQ72360.1 glycosyl transferase [Kutzneria sp. CA-103260]
MTGHIAFFSFPAYAHLAPTLPVVEELVRRGHRVTYAAADRFADQVEAVGAELLRYDSTFPWQEGIPENVAGQAIAFIDEALSPLPAALERFTGDVPDLFVHDSAATEAARLLARHWGRTSVQSSAVFVSNSAFSLNQAQDAGRGDNQLPMGDMAALEKFAQRQDEILDGLGLSHVDIEGFGGDNGPNVVYLPREFQVKGETFGPEFCFVGPMLADQGEDDDWRPPAAGVPVVLISLGTSPSPGRAEFFTNCAKAFADTPWHVVMTLGSSPHPDELGPLPANVEARQWVKHPAVLRHADVFVTHSGMGSVMEALSIGVPLVCVPHHAEQNVNAARAAELGLGVVVDRETAAADELVDQVNRVAGDAGFRRAAEAMRDSIASAGGVTRATDFVESLMGNSGN